MVVTLTVKQVAEALGLHPNTIQSYIKQGRLKAFRIGRPWRIPVSELARYGLSEAGEVSRIVKEAQK